MEKTEKIWIQCNYCGHVFFLDKLGVLAYLSIALNKDKPRYTCDGCGKEYDFLSIFICYREDGECDGCEQLYRCYFENATKKA